LPQESDYDFFLLENPDNSFEITLCSKTKANKQVFLRARLKKIEGRQLLITLNGDRPDQ
jgi:hypothetical protein